MQKYEISSPYHHIVVNVLYVKARNINVQRERVRENLHRLDSIGRNMRRQYAICRVNDVPGPNLLWLIDSNHKLISWRFVIHGCVDGFS